MYRTEVNRRPKKVGNSTFDKLSIAETAAELRVSTDFVRDEIGKRRLASIRLISHRKESFERAKEIGEQLCVFGAGRIVVHYSVETEAENDWRRRVEQNLTDASWFILLYDGPLVDWDWCLFETGFFIAKAEDQEKRRLFLLHKPEDTVPSPMQNFFSVPAMEEPLRKLFRELYAINPGRLIRPYFVETNGSLTYRYDE
jgi:hypothetical protein